MSSAGTIMDMLNRVHYNRNQLKIRMEKRSEMRKRFISQVNLSSGLDFYKDNIPAETVERAKENVRIKLRNEKKRSLIVLSVSVVIGIGVVFIIAKLVATGLGRSF